MVDTTAMKSRFRTVKEAPEGGWGFCIAVGMAMPFVNTKKYY